MNDLSVVSYIKNDIEFLDQYWAHIHSYSPREIAIVDTGSTDGTYEKLVALDKDENIIYKIESAPQYTGRVYSFNRAVNMATSKWVMKIDVDELCSRATQNVFFETISEGKYDCIGQPTIHHFINSGLFFNCIADHPDYHQRLFRKDIFDFNSTVNSRNHGSVIWKKQPTILTLDFNHPLYHYSFLRNFKKIQKRSIVNYFIDEKVPSVALLKDVESNTDRYIEKFTKWNTEVTPAWQTEPTTVRFNDLESYYAKEFLRWGKRVDFDLPEDLTVNKISEWPNENEIIKNIQ